MNTEISKVVHLKCNVYVLYGNYMNTEINKVVHQSVLFYPVWYSNWEKKIIKKQYINC